MRAAINPNVAYSTVFCFFQNHLNGVLFRKWRIPVTSPHNNILHAICIQEQVRTHFPLHEVHLLEIL